MTLGVLTQLLASARDTLVVAVPFLQQAGPLNTEPLASALRAALERRVAVDIVSTASGLRTLDVPALRRQARARLRLFRSSANIEDEKRLGSHAKFFIADGTSAYVGSANLTGPSLSTNLEIGFLVHGTAARQLESLWKTLVEIGFFIEV